MMNKTVGLIGVGIMGKQMVPRLIADGYTVYANDNSDLAKEFCKEHGVEVLATKAELAEKTDKIICSLPNPKVCMIVANELAKVVNSRHIVMETSTMVPDAAKEIEAVYTESGASFVEGCILGRPAGAGEWTIIAGGDAEAVKIMEPVMLPFSSRVVHSGTVGSANGIKVLNTNMLCIFTSAICETFAMADAVGVDKEALYDIVSKSVAATNCGAFKEVGKRIVDNNFEDPNASLLVGAKDNLCGKDLARTGGISPTFTISSLMAFENAISFGLGDLDTASIYKYFSHVYKNNL